MKGTTMTSTKPRARTKKVQPNLPWSANRPTDEELRRHVRDERMTDEQIAAKYGVRRQTVAYWRRHPREGDKITRPVLHRNGVPLYSHRDLLPWTLAPEHRSHVVTRRLMTISRLRQGDTDISPGQEHLAREFEAFLNETGRVVVYSRESGYQLVKRRASDTDIVRAPAQRKVKRTA